MAKEKNVGWAAIGIIIAVLVLAASIVFATIKISGTVDTSVEKIREKIRDEITREIKSDLRREAIAFIYAYRSCSVEGRQMTNQDLKEGYQFAEEFLAGK